MVRAAPERRGASWLAPLSTSRDLLRASLHRPAPEAHVRPLASFRLPASALAWMLLAAGHAAGWAAPVPAALRMHALAACAGLGAVSLLAGAAGSRRAGVAR
ncbi:MAG TPA: hypothetical protein VFM00_09565, partial [Candidatus Eisenbacteria bacterium]|nr:hypothetical protein [Candidatus Eisenbacteria bacterium]